MAVKLKIPTALRGYAGGHREVALEGATVAEVLESFASEYPDIRLQIFEESGALRAYVNLFVGDTNIKNLNGFETPLQDGATLMLVPAIAGGRPGILAGPRRVTAR